MMYYIIKNDKNIHVIKPVENTNDNTYHDLKREGYDVKGQFGREDYAQHWVNWYNGDITKKEHKQFLNL